MKKLAPDEPVLDLADVHYGRSAPLVDLRTPRQSLPRSDDHPMARHSPSAVVFGSKARKVMGEYGAGLLKSSAGTTVTNPKEALAIAFSEQRRMGKA